jgi:integrase
MGCRDHAMLYLMTHYGLRTGEVCGLKLEDLDFSKRLMRVTQSKTRQLLTLPLTDPATCILKRYIEFGAPPYDTPVRLLERTCATAAGIPALNALGPTALGHRAAGSCATA